MSAALALLSVIAQQALTPTPVLNPGDFFKAYPYTGNAENRTVSTGLDLSESGSLVWASPRNGSYDQFWATDTVDLSPNTNEADFFADNWGPRPNEYGFDLKGWQPYNEDTVPYMSWSFKKALGFYTVVQYTGNGSTKVVAHDLGSPPGLIFVKRTDAESSWAVWHADLPEGYLTTTLGALDLYSEPTAFTAAPDEESLPLGNSDLNTNDGEYVAYIFARESSILRCGSVEVDNSGEASVDLGWEPQFLLFKALDGSDLHWNVVDTQRGWGTGSPKTIRLSGGGTEYSTDSGASKTSTGFDLSAVSEGTYIFMAIRKE